MSLDRFDASVDRLLLQSYYLLFLVVYGIGIIFSDIVLHEVYTKGKWANKVEYVWKTNVIKFTPVLNIVYPLILLLRGFHKH